MTGDATAATARISLLASAIGLLATLWDSPEDAAEFTEALPASEKLQWRRDADRVAIVAGVPAKKASRLLDRMLETEDPLVEAP